ncbi:MAG: tRNA (adenosine(37)-N6)-dimethylallyltransferase MiaA [Synergistaceae bacterium]|nr:tRNA (adenosine(37)-N6)-dimethylallyltransferase MiaA [Synergistaceae bacterium]
MTGERIPLVAIIGPTAVGKTEFSLSLARELNAEVISVDSRQVYRYLDVGTDKVSRETRREIIHHLIDIADPDQIYSAASFAADACGAARRIIARGRSPLLIGGTPFYYRALSGALSEALPSDENVRSQLLREIEERGLSALHDELKTADPEAAARIHPNDPVRTMRALEIFRITGRSASWWYAEQRKLRSPYDIFYIGLTRLRANLYANIERRVKEQFASGYPEEVAWLLDNGYSPSLPAMQGFGYRELVDYIQGRITLREAIDGDIRSTKAFSRRQMTWFKHFEPACWFDFDEISKEEALKRAVPKCLDHLNGGNKR